MLRKIIFCLTLVFSALGYSQSENKNIKPKTENFSIAISVDSAEEIEEALSPKNTESFFEIMGYDEEITFKLKCNFSEDKDKIKGNMTYSITGKGNEKEQFLKDLKRVKTLALKFYNLKTH